MHGFKKALPIYNFISFVCLVDQSPRRRLSVSHKNPTKKHSKQRWKKLPFRTKIVHFITNNVVELILHHITIGPNMELTTKTFHRYWLIIQQKSEKGKGKKRSAIHCFPENFAQKFRQVKRFFGKLIIFFYL